jgi:hypothetical protein
VGGGNVVHYGTLACRLRSGLVEKISLAIFAHGHVVLVRPHIAPRFACAEVIRRALSRLGENNYGLLCNNCEHFCEWCVQGVPRSYQVERVVKFPHAVARTIRTALRVIGTTSVFGQSPRLRRKLPAESTAQVLGTPAFLGPFSSNDEPA